jgi:hypothetical protein
MDAIFTTVVAFVAPLIADWTPEQFILAGGAVFCAIGILVFAAMLRGDGSRKSDNQPY